MHEYDVIQHNVLYTSWYKTKFWRGAKRTETIFALNHLFVFCFSWKEGKRRTRSKVIVLFVICFMSWFLLSLMSSGSIKFTYFFIHSMHILPLS